MTIRILSAKLAALVLAGWMTGMPASAETFTLRIGAGQPMKPLEPIFVAHNYFVPKVKERVAAETEHEIRFIEAYGGTVAGPNDVLEAVEKGLFDIGLWCACFEPTKAGHLAFHFYLPFVTDDPMTQLQITRQIYKEFPEWTDTLDKYNQKFLGGATYSSYGLGSTFEWKTVDDLAGRKIGGAGPNLEWIKQSGAVAVQSNLNEAYNSMQSGVYEGFLIMPPPWVGFKLNEPAPVYTLVGWGAMTLYFMSANNDSWGKLPDDVKAIFLEEADNYMTEVALESTRRHKTAMDALRASGSIVQTLAAEERRKMAVSLGRWPNENAKRYNEMGLPGSAMFKRYLEIAKKVGAEITYSYEID